MSNRHSSIAKITRPNAANILPRERLFRALDNARKHQVIWVSGPAGSGKTKLVSSYLDSRKLPCLWYQMDEGDGDLATFFYYMGVAVKKAAPRHRRALPLFTPEYSLDHLTFCRRFFESLSSRLRSPFVPVFDDYQKISSDPLLQETIRTGLSALHEEITAIIISRSEPAPAFAGMQAGNKLRIIGWSDLKLTSVESKGIAKLQDVGPRGEKVFKWLHEKSQGWAAGVVLLARAVGSEGIDTGEFESVVPENVFDYFAEELFDRLDAAFRDFLLKTAIVPRIMPRLAEKLTGNKSAGRILADLNRTNYFIEKRSQPETVYQYHALFREFLLSRAEKELDKDDSSRIRLTAASVLEDAGAVEDAAEMIMQAGERPALIRLILAHARTLVEQGRNKTLEAWLMRLPVAERAKNPWILFWMGICRACFDPVEGRIYLTQACRFDSKHRPHA